jgi:hypothetical protein
MCFECVKNISRNYYYLDILLKRPYIHTWKQKKVTKLNIGLLVGMHIIWITYDYDHDDTNTFEKGLHERILKHDFRDIVMKANMNPMIFLK